MATDLLASRIEGPAYQQREQNSLREAECRFLGYSAVGLPGLALLRRPRFRKPTDRHWPSQCPAHRE
jgi:hypothetical protein